MVGFLCVRNFLKQGLCPEHDPWCDEYYKSQYRIYYLFIYFHFSEEVENLSRHLGSRLIRTSVKEDVNVSSIFRYLATKCHQQMMNEYNDAAPIGQPTISTLILLLIRLEAKY